MQKFSDKKLQKQQFFLLYHLNIEISKFFWILFINFLNILYKFSDKTQSFSDKKPKSFIFKNYKNTTIFLPCQILKYNNFLNTLYKFSVKTKKFSVKNHQNFSDKTPKFQQQNPKIQRQKTSKILSIKINKNTTIFCLTTYSTPDKLPLNANKLCILRLQFLNQKNWKSIIVKSKFFIVREGKNSNG